MFDFLNLLDFQNIIWLDVTSKQKNIPKAKEHVKKARMKIQGSSCKSKVVYEFGGTNKRGWFKIKFKKRKRKMKNRTTTTSKGRQRLQQIKEGTWASVRFTSRQPCRRYFFQKRVTLTKWKKLEQVCGWGWQGDKKHLKWLSLGFRTHTEAERLNSYLNGISTVLSRNDYHAVHVPLHEWRTKVSC